MNEVADWAEQVEQTSKSWFDGTGEEEEELNVTFRDYEITSSPNDFNITTIVDFVNRGIFVIPGFQRNYVWDIKRASRLIESLIVGLPIPQLFLYEEKRNSLLVIDGQQRLMSIYYFLKGRFPRRSKRPELRRIMAENKTIPDRIMADDTYFQKFNLDLKSRWPAPIGWSGFSLSALRVLVLQLGWPAKRLRMAKPATGWRRELAGDTPVMSAGAWCCNGGASSR